jgi:hypothetical protein
MDYEIPKSPDKKSAKVISKLIHINKKKKVAKKKDYNIIIIKEIKT